MSSLYVREYADQVLLGRGLSAPAGMEPGLVDQKLTISGSTVQSAAFNAKTRLIRVHTDVICSIVIGPNAIATTGGARMAANTTEYFGVNKGDMIAAISNT
jgi:hypothetical protein